ncbi:MAG: S-methyl-5'-thioinosine phosphorylase [Limnobacter sp.]|nr:S-methyl-5'-thioinosine phosphorylase [Limnobacter sp.]
MYAIIGGSGLSRMLGFTLKRRQVMRTPYGEPSGALMIGDFGGQEVVFLARHGYGHTIAPHEINYRANLWALSQLETQGIVSVASVGSVVENLPAGQIVIPDQIIDYTWGRPSTFFEGNETPVQHIDFTLPYDKGLRSQLIAAADAIEEPVEMSGCYACTQGPRLETAAEIKKLARDGAHIVGMTGMPEAALARELEIPYAHIALVVNAGAGLGDSAEAISHAQIAQVVEEGMQRVTNVIRSLVTLNVE